MQLARYYASSLLSTPSLGTNASLSYLCFFLFLSLTFGFTGSQHLQYLTQLSLGVVKNPSAYSQLEIEMSLAALDFCLEAATSGKFGVYHFVLVCFLVFLTLFVVRSHWLAAVGC